MLKSKEILEKIKSIISHNLSKKLEKEKYILSQEFIKQQELEIKNCTHAFVIIEYVKDEVTGEMIPVYYCPKCGLTNFFIVHGIESKDLEFFKMNYLYNKYVKNGILISNHVISKDEANEFYQTLKDENIADAIITDIMRDYFNNQKKLQIKK